MEFLFILCFVLIFGRLLTFGIKAAWGISKLLVTVVFLPIILTLMVVCGFISLAFPMLLIIGIISVLILK